MKFAIVSTLISIIAFSTLSVADDDVKHAVDAPPSRIPPLSAGSRVPPGAHGRSRRAATCGAQTKISASQAVDVVYAHNLCRGKENAANALQMTWDDEMASVAQAWANTCTWEHGMLYDCSGDRIGQNLFVEASSGGYPALNVTGVVVAWNNERNDWDFPTGKCRAGKTCGHFTQVAWARSAKMGCGYAQCPTMNVAGVTWKNALFLVCDYTAPGNVVGETMYIAGTPCSNCDSDKTGEGFKCDKNLCVRCTPATDAACKCGTPLSCLNGGTWTASKCACTCPKAWYGLKCEHPCSCADQTPLDCPDYKEFCTDPDYSEFMEDNCRATCGFACTLPPSCTA